MMKLLVVVFLFVSLSLNAQGEENNENLTVFVEGGYLLGGQTTSNTFVYQTGLTGRVGVKKPLSPFFNLGAGIGVDTYDFVEFVPIYITVDAQAKPEKNGVFTSFFGYSIAHSKDKTSSISQRTEGGGFLEVGRAWRFKINEQFRFLGGISVKHQFGILETENPFGGDDEIRTDFDGIHVRLGILIN